MNSRQRKRHAEAQKRYVAKLPKEFTTWKSMIIRCRYSSHKSFECYGGRGIAVCPEWTGRGGFERFLQDMGPRPEGYSIDRVDPDKGYCRDNCIWIPLAENCSKSRGCFRSHEEVPI